MKRKNKPNIFVIIGSMYFLILLTISVAYSFFNTDLSIKATTGVASEEYDSDYILEAKWSNGDQGPFFYQYTVNFKYLDTTPTTGWKYYIKVPYDTEIVGCYSAESCVVEGEVLTITNEINNGVLSPDNQNASFGFQMKTNTPDYIFQTTGISFIKDNAGDFDDVNPGDNPDKPDPSDGQLVDYITPTLSVTGGWGNTTTYVFKVSNTSETTSIRYWSARLKFPVGSQISSLWGGQYEYNSETGELTLHAPEWAPTLGPVSSNEVNIYMTTSEPSPYTPTIVGFYGVTTEDVKITANIIVQ